MEATVAFSSTQTSFEDVVDCLTTMRNQEKKSYGSSDYLSNRNKHAPLNVHQTDLSTDDQALLSSPPSVDAVCRKKMCEWFYQIVDHCKISRDTVAYTMSYIDRFLATKVGWKYLADRSMFQLASVTAFFTAIKLHGEVDIDINTMCRLCRGSYTTKQISDMEQTLLSALEWKMNPPLSTAFVETVLQLLPEEKKDISNDVYEVARYQIELATSDYNFSKNFASEVAVAALLNAVEYMHSSRLDKKTRRDFFCTIGTASGQDIYDTETAVLREQLLDVFVESRGHDLKETLQLRPKSSAEYTSNERTSIRKHDNASEMSPCCVSRR